MNRKFENYLNSLEINKFSGREWEIKDGFFKGNCTGLVKTFLPSLVGNSAYEIFESLKNESQVPLKDIRSGDLIIWRKTVLSKKGSTGHIAFIDNVIRYSEYELVLRVFDCVKKPHTDDIRVDGGVGFGTIKIILKNGKAQGFVWGGDSSKTKLTEVLFCRLD